MTHDHWILVADASRARIFGSDLLLEEFEELGAYVHAASRLHGQNLVTDRPGRSRSHGHEILDDHTNRKVHESDVFARELAVELATGERERRFERLVVVAPPKLLGQLRSHLSRAVEQRIVASIHKDLTRVKRHEMPEAIRSRLPVDAGLPENVHAV